MVAESFFLTYIILDAINLIFVFLILGIVIAAVILLIKMVALYDEQIQLAPDLDDKRDFRKFKRQLFGRSRVKGFLQRESWKKGAPIWIFFVARISLAYAFIRFDLPLLFLFIFIGFLDFIDSRLIALAEENTWKLLDYGVAVGVNVIILSMYWELLWVKIIILLYPVLFIGLIADLDLIQLEAFIPDVLAILSFYGDPVLGGWVLPVALASFIYNLYYDVLVF